MKIGYWEPVYNTGCGWRDCPECGPLIEVEIEAAHRRKARQTVPEGNRISEWLADAYGSGAEREFFAGRRKAARADRMRAREKVRIKRILKPEQQSEAMSICEKLIRPADAEKQADWLAESFMELLNPTVTVAKREGSMRLGQKVRRAIFRARRNIWRRKKDDRKYVSRKVL